LVGSSVTV